jgi:hypothetical protein
MAIFLRSLALILVFTCPVAVSLAQSVNKAGGDSAVVTRKVKAKLNSEIKDAGKKIKNITPKIPEVKVKALLDSVSLKDSLKLSGLKDGISSAIGVNEKADKLKNSVKNLDPSKSAGQAVRQLDTQVKAIGEQVSGFTDTLKTLAPVKNALKSTKVELWKLDPTEKITNAKNVAVGKAAAFKTAAKEKLKSLRKPGVSLALTLEDAERYQSVPQFGLNTTSKYVNVFSARGTLTAFGVPVNIDYTTDRASSIPPGAIGNDLFKFDLSPGSLSGLYKSGLQQYLDVRRNFFGGQDLSAYTWSRLEQRLATEEAGLAGRLNKDAVTGYLKSASGLQELLVMDKASIIKKLQEQSQTKLAGYEKAAKGTLMSPASKLLNDKARSQKQMLKEIAGNGSLQGYLNDPAHMQELMLMSQEQVRQKIVSLSAVKKQSEKVDSEGFPEHFFVGNTDLGTVVSGILMRETNARDSVTSELAKQVMLSARQDNRVDLQAEVDKKNRQIDLATDSMGYTAPDSVAAESKQRFAKIADVIVSVRKELEDKGLDINQMLSVQQYLDNGTKWITPTEFGSGLQRGMPVNAAQKALGKISAFKLGAYSNKVPGGVANQDLFMNGGHITVKTGMIPLTFGYGSVGDITSFKDQGYQNSVYNQPRNVTFIGAEMRRPGSGSFKLSVISSVNREVRNNLYAMPTISSNNVAYTISKGLNVGRLGALDVDVSKSTTVYANKFQPGSEAILNTKGGLNYDLSNDLFQALSFGVNHHLDLPGIGASDNFYFNYSGMGYQNPADNGFGGAKMKFGGSIKKAFDRNKITFTLRSDMGNMPISYTSDDRWKTYQFQLDSRYAISRKFSLNVNYTTNGTDKRVAGISSQVYTFQKIQVNGNASYKVGKYFSVSHFGIGTQDISSAGAAGSGNVGSKLLLVNYVQSMVIRKDVLTFNLFYNRELTGVKLIGNMLNTDLSYQYMLFNKLSLSSGFTYLENTGIVKQAGLRQSIQLLSVGHFDVGSFVDLRKDMITPLYSGLYPQCRAELSLKYHLDAF